jgi:hypothetical protein
VVREAKTPVAGEANECASGDGNVPGPGDGWTSIRRPLRAGIVGPMLACGCAASAQQVTLEPSAALRCLQPSVDRRGAPEHPLDLWKRKPSGRVKVALEFAGPDHRPAVEVLEREGNRDFVAAVREHVRDYRMPCLDQTGIPARLVFEFVFRPDEPQALFSEPLEADEPEHRRCCSASAMSAASARRRIRTTCAAPRCRGVCWLRFVSSRRTPRLGSNFTRATAPRDCGAPRSAGSRGIACLATVADRSTR